VTIPPYWRLGISPPAVVIPGRKFSNSARRSDLFSEMLEQVRVEYWFRGCRLCRDARTFLSADQRAMSGADPLRQDMRITSIFAVIASSGENALGLEREEWAARQHL